VCTAQYSPCCYAAASRIMWMLQPVPQHNAAQHQPRSIPRKEHRCWGSAAKHTVSNVITAISQETQSTRHLPSPLYTTHPPQGKGKPPNPLRPLRCLCFSTHHTYRVSRCARPVSGNTPPMSPMQTPAQVTNTPPFQKANSRSARESNAGTHIQQTSERRKHTLWQMQPTTHASMPTSKQHDKPRRQHTM
jgi:hypothetical protein